MAAELSGRSTEKNAQSLGAQSLSDPPSRWADCSCRLGSASSTGFSRMRMACRAEDATPPSVPKTSGANVFGTEYGTDCNDRKMPAP